MTEGALAPSDAPEKRPSGGPLRLFGVRGVALAELSLFFALAFIIDWSATGLTRFEGIQPHPYWLIVLLLAAQYGTNEGVIAAGAATCALRLWNLPEQAIGQDLYEYLHTVSREPILWLVAAMLFGELRMRQRREHDELRAKLALASRESDAIALSYRQLKLVKENLEARVAGQLRTVFTLYQAARAIDKLDEGEVMLGVADLVRSVMRPEKFSLFLLNNDVLESVTNDGWDDGDPYARWFDASSPLFRTVVGGQRTLCVARPEDERILMGEGVLAGPLVSEDTGEVVGMVKIESLGFADFSANTVENFRILCEWIGTALAKARRYREANEQKVFADDGTLYSSTYIGRQAEFLAHLGRRLGFETTTITIRPSGLSRLSPDQRMEVATAIGRAVRQSLRDTDLACDFGQHGLVFGVVLPGTAVEQARIVASKLEKAVRGSLPPPLVGIPISFAAERVGDGP